MTSGSTGTSTTKNEAAHHARRNQRMKKVKETINRRLIFGFTHFDDFTLKS
jgi:hypothetical protein